jgi:hypothetical protein
MNEVVGNGKPAAYAPGMDRRQRKPDVWSRVLRYVTLFVYPILIINLFIFAAIASEEQKAGMAQQKGWIAAQDVSNWVSLNAFLPIMLAGALIGMVGLFLSRKRARRRYDYKFQNQLILIVLSAAGLVAYLLVR